VVFEARLPRRLWMLATLVLLAGGVAYAEGRVHASPEAVEPLEPGERVPSATVERVTGEPVDLAALVRDGALLVFYRGGW